MPLAPDIATQHLERVRAFYDGAPTRLSRAARSYRELLAHYYNLLIPAGASVLEIGCGSGGLLARLRGPRKVGVDLSVTQVAAGRVRVPEAEFHVQAGEELELSEQFDCIDISDTLNFAADVQRLLEGLHRVAHADTRLIINFYSSLWGPVLSLGRMLGINSRQPQAAGSAHPMCATFSSWPTGTQCLSSRDCDFRSAALGSTCSRTAGSCPC